MWAGWRSLCSQPREEPGRPRGRVGRAWPAVSQICSVIFCEPMVSSLTKKLAPMVDAVYLGRGPRTSQPWAAEVQLAAGERTI